MESKTSQIKHTFVYGSVTGGIICIYLLLLFFFGMMNKTNLVNISGLIFIGGAILSVKRYRDSVMGGVLNFGKTYGTALLTLIFTSVVWAIYGYIQYKYLAPGLLEDKIIQSQEALLKMGRSEEMVEAQSEMMRLFLTPFTNAVFGYLFSAAFWGSILALPIAGLMKRSENPLLKDNV